MNRHTQPLRLAATLAACAALALLTSACGKRQSAGGPPQRPPVAVQTAPAVKMDTPVVVTAFGNTEDRASVDVIPQVSGILLQRFIDDGAVVTNGQPLFLIDPSDYTARVRQSEGAVAADRANLALSRITVERNQPLIEKKLISQEDFDTLKARLEAAQAQLQVDEAALEQARLNLARCTIRAPLDGVCSRRYVDDGNLVTAGLTRLTNIRSYDPIRVDFTVPEQYVSLIRRALAQGPVRLGIRTRGDTNIYGGTLDFVDNTVSTQTGTILLRGQAPNPGMKLWAGQFVDVTIYAGVIPGAVMIPEGAIQYGKQGTYVFVAASGAGAKEHNAEMRLVTTGVRYGDLVQIVRGVTPAENVIVLGQLMLYPGAPVADVSHLPPGGVPDAAAKPSGQGGR